MTKVDLEPTDSEIKQDLCNRLLSPVTVGDLASEITQLLDSLEKRKVKRKVLARLLANKLAPKFGKGNVEVARLIERWPRELQAFCHELTWEAVQAFIKENPHLMRKRRAKVTNEADRIRRRKMSKNRYERRRGSPSQLRLIEEQFGKEPNRLLLDPFQKIASLGFCLDDIFRGGEVQMSTGHYSLQNLFGLDRKKLSGAAPGIPRGRQFFYDFRAVLRCMDSLLVQTGGNADWLSDPSLRRTVLSGVLLRAKQAATEEIATEFERILLPHLN